MTPSQDSAVLVADPGAPPLARLKTAHTLLELGRGDGVIRALDDLAQQPKYAVSVRKLGLYANFLAQSLRWLDFAGRQASQENAGRWETLDGSPPDPTGKTGSGVLLWVRPGASRVVVVFSHLLGFGGPMRGWLSIVLLHRALKPIDASIVYVMGDPHFLHFAGVRGLGEHYETCIDRLGAEFRTRRWTAIYTVGVSAGGYSALRFGLDLEARGVLSFSGPTSLLPADCDDPGFLHLQQQRPAAELELVPLYRAHRQRPRLLLCYGAANPADTEAARRMTEFPECELVPIEGFFQHASLIESLRRKQLHVLVQRLFACV